MIIIRTKLSYFALVWYGIIGTGQIIFRFVHNFQTAIARRLSPRPILYSVRVLAIRYTFLDFFSHQWWSSQISKRPQSIEFFDWQYTNTIAPMYHFARSFLYTTLRGCHLLNFIFIVGLIRHKSLGTRYGICRCGITSF
jgi:hypothetical protein